MCAVPSVSLAKASQFFPVSRYPLSWPAPSERQSLLFDQQLDYIMAFPVEVYLQICSLLPKRDLINMQLASRALLAISTSALYEIVKLKEETSGMLSQTLKDTRPLRPLVRSLRVSTADSSIIDRSANDLDKLICPLLGYCNNLRALDIDWPIELEAANATFFDQLSNLPAITSFTFKVPSGQAPLLSLLPSLRVWAPHLQTLAIQGLHAPTSCTACFEPLEFTVLRNLSLTYCEISDWAFEGLFGQIGQLHDLELDLMSPNAPSDGMLRRVLLPRLASLNRLKIEENWISSAARSYELGRDFVSSCTPGQLVNLSLSGRISQPDLLTLPHLQYLCQLDLSWISTSCFEDLLTWLEGRNGPKPSRLHSLSTQLIGYEEDLNQETVKDLKRASDKEGICFKVNARFGRLEAVEGYGPVAVLDA